MRINTSLMVEVAGAAPAYLRRSSLPACGFESSLEKILVSNRNIVRLETNLTIAKSMPGLVRIAQNRTLQLPYSCAQRGGATRLNMIATNPQTENDAAR